MMLKIILQEMTQYKVSHWANTRKDNTAGQPV